MRYYIALIHKDADSDFGVSFPDLPGCVTAGRDLAEARAMAEEALALHLEGLAADGDPVPEPSDLDRVMSDPENREGVAVLVPAPEVRMRAVRVNVTFPEDLLASIDAYASRHGFNRSGFLAKAAREMMSDRRDGR
ncbi:type II toxin-antitoxin system HicB family antitoxin [Aquibaculum sediminis]|uniref:type II toxin-antitoxin system HicB family antitoxin n=1 Tax=Aquibaculum sediminis TaxID=3231907 RepID=UPI0034512D8C